MTIQSVGSSPTPRPLHLTILSAMESTAGLGTEFADKIAELQRLRVRQNGKLGKKSEVKLVRSLQYLTLCLVEFRTLAQVYVGATVPADHDEIVRTMTKAIKGMRVRRKIRGNAVIFEALDWVAKEKGRAGPAPNPRPSTPPAPDQRDGGLDEPGQSRSNAA